MTTMAGRGFRIASAYVEVVGQPRREQIRRTSERVGRDAGRAYAGGWARTSTQGAQQAAARVGRDAGRSYAGGWARTSGEGVSRAAQGHMTTVGRQHAQWGTAGQQAGGAYSQGFAGASRGVGQSAQQSAHHVQQTAAPAFQSAGAASGAGFASGAAGGMSGMSAAMQPALGGFLAAAGLVGGSVLSLSGDFEHAMSAVQAVTGATGKDFDRLTDLAKEMGRTTQFSAAEAAAGMEFLGMAGWNTEQILTGLPDVLQLAAAGGIDLASAANYTSNIMSALGMDVSETGRVVDALAKTAASTNTNVLGLGDSAARIAGAAKSAGWSIEDMTEALGSMGDVGIASEVSATSLNSILGDLMDTGSKATEVFQKYGVEVLDANGNVRNYTDIVADAKDAGMKFNDMTEAFGKEHGPKFAQTLGLTHERLAEIKEATHDTAGAAERMAAVRMDNFKGQLTSASSAAQGLAIAIGDMGILAFATTLMEKFVGVLRGVTDMLTRHQDVIRRVMSVLLPFAAAFAAVIAGALALKATLAVLSAAFAFLLSPIGLVAAGIAAITTVLVLAWKRSERFRNVVTAVWERVQEAAARVVDFFQSRVAPVLRKVWDRISTKALEMANRFAEHVWPLVQKAIPYVQAAAGRLADFFRDRVAPALRAVWPRVEKAAKRLSDFFENTLAPALKDLWPPVKELAREMVDFFENSVWPAMGEGWKLLKEAAHAAMAALREAFGGLAKDGESAGDVVRRILAGVKDRLRGLRDSVRETMQQVREIWSEHGERILETVRAAWGQAFATIAYMLKNLMVVVKGAWTIISGVVAGALKILKGMIQVATGVISGDWGRVWDGIKNIFSGIWKQITSILKGAWQIISGIFTNMWNFVTGIFKRLYNWLVGNSLIPDLVNAVILWLRRMRDRGAELVAMMRDWVIDRVRVMRDRAMDAVRGLRDRAIEIMTGWRDRLRAIAGDARDWVVTRVRDLRDKVRSALETMRDKAISAFTRAKDGIKTAWDKLEEVAKKPVSFVINTVYNDGIRKFWNAIAGKIGLGNLERISGFAAGGVVDLRKGAHLPGYSRTDDTLAMVRSGEGVLVPEAVQALGGPGFIHAANAAGSRAGELRGYERGGIISKIGGAVGGFIDKGKGFFSDGFVKALDAVTGPIISGLKELFGREGFQGLPTRLVEFLVARIKGWLAPKAGELEGGSGRKVADIARKEVGHHGRPNKYTRAPGMWTDEWCGMFVDWVFRKAGARAALSKVANTPAVRSYTALSKTSLAKARPGDLALYRGDTGHINIVTDPASRETVGGNERNNRVVKTAGYVNSASSIRRPTGFQDGGVVDAEDVRRAGGLGELRRIVWQDRKETATSALDAAMRARREMFAPPPGTHDSGGVLLDGHAGINRSGAAEMVLTAARLDRWASATGSGGGGVTVTGPVTVTVQAREIKEAVDVLRVLERLPQVARSHGARRREGMP
ncbi:hypothetical protein GCM10027160_23480 [Streptomyces calidiresistens]